MSFGNNPKHDWNTLENYLAVHDKFLRKVIAESYVRGPTQYSIRKLTDQNIEISLKGLVLRSSVGTEVEFKIEKTALIDISYARPRARTYDYSYHALLPKPLGLNLMRYCSPHEHRPFHHKHVYDRDGLHQVIQVAEGAWPHISDFIAEVLANF